MSAGMMSLRFYGALLASVAALSGCLPDRDNRNDVVNRPTASLLLAHGPFEGGACGTADSTDVSPFSRGRCLWLNAAESTDPQGDDDIIEYRYEWRIANTDSAFKLLVSSAADLESVAPTTLRTDLPFYVPLEARVHVEDGLGGEDVSVEEPFMLENSAPIAIVPSARQVPKFGSLWLRTADGKIGGPLDVRLDGSGSIDAEDDPLTYCWREIGTETNLTPLPPCSTPNAYDTCLNDPATPEIVVIVANPAAPPAATEVIYDLQVCDGNLWSRPAKGSIVRDLSPGWALDADFDEAVVQDLLVDRHLFNISVVGVPALVFPPSGPPLALLGFDDPSTGPPERNLVGVLAVDSAGAPSPSVQLPSSSFGVPVVRQVFPAPGASQAMFWVTTSVGTAGNAVYAVTSGGTLEATEPFFPDPPMPLIGGQVVHGEWDPAEEIFWFSSTFSSHVYGLRHVNGAPDTIELVQQIDIAPDAGSGHPRSVTGLHRRPTTLPGGPSQLFIAHSGNILVPGAADPAGYLVRDENGAVTETLLDIPPDFADFGIDQTLVGGPFFVSKNFGFFTFFGSGIGVVVLDEDQGFTLVGFAPFDDVGISPVVHPATNRLLLIDPSGHHVIWATQGAGVGILPTTRGIQRFLADAVNAQVWAFLPDELGTGAEFVSGLGTGIEGAVNRFPLPPQFGISTPSLDFASGDLWTTSTFPVGALRFGVDGRIADVIAGVTADGLGCPNDIVLGAPAHAVSDPATGDLWIVTVQDSTGGARVVFRVDPYASRGTPTYAQAAGVCDSRLPPEEQILKAFVQPTFASNVTTSGALVMLTETTIGAPASPFKLRRMLRDGVQPIPDGVTLVGAAGASNSIDMSRDLVNGDICVAGRVGASQIAVQIHEANLSTALPAQVVTAGGGAKVASTAAFDGECWVAFTGALGPKLMLYRPKEPTNLLLNMSEEIDTVVAVVSPEAPDTFDKAKRRAWVSVPGDRLMHRVAVTTTGGPNAFLMIEETVPVPGEMRLVAP